MVGMTPRVREMESVGIGLIPLEHVALLHFSCVFEQLGPLPCAAYRLSTRPEPGHTLGVTTGRSPGSVRCYPNIPRRLPGGHLSTFAKLCKSRSSARTTRFLAICINGNELLCTHFSGTHLMEFVGIASTEPEREPGDRSPGILHSPSQPRRRRRYVAVGTLWVIEPKGVRKPAKDDQ
jgi:hypothetical protein